MLCIIMHAQLTTGNWIPSRWLLNYIKCCKQDVTGAQSLIVPGLFLICDTHWGTSLVLYPLTCGLMWAREISLSCRQCEHCQILDIHLCSPSGLSCQQIIIHVSVRVRVVCFANYAPVDWEICPAKLNWCAVDWNVKSTCTYIVCPTWSFNSLNNFCKAVYMYMYVRNTPREHELWDCRLFLCHSCTESVIFSIYWLQLFPHHPSSTKVQDSNTHSCPKEDSSSTYPNSEWTQQLAICPPSLLYRYMLTMYM